MTPITLWNPGDAPLTDLQHANNIRGLFELCTGLQETSGAIGIASVTTSQIAPGIPGVMFTLTDGRVFGPLALPYAAMNWKGARIAGQALLARDVTQFQGSTYYVLTDHVASATLNDDLAAGKIALMARAGKDAEVFQGLYNAAQAYPASSVVIKDGVFWKTMIDVAVGGLAPGAPGASWAIALYTSVPSANVYITAEAKTLAVVIGELRTEIANLKDRVTALEAA